MNILGDYEAAFRLASKYQAIIYGQELQKLREATDVVLLGGVRFKYQPVASGRIQEQDLLIGKERCDAVVCIGESTNIPTPFGKVDEFNHVLKGLPVIVGAGMTIHTAQETFQRADGAIVGSWLKYGHETSNKVNENYVAELVKKIEPYVSF